jgi:hypothetical protein
MRFLVLSLLLSITCISLLSSCTVEQSDIPEAIRFGQIVGNYTGKMDRCTISLIRSDSVCTQNFEEKLIISISDQKNIYIRTQSELIPRTKLMLLYEENISGNKKFVFSSTHENVSHSLSYESKENKVLYTGTMINDQTTTSTRFEGEK